MNDLLIKFVMFRSWYPQIAGFLFCAIKSSAIIFLGAAVALFLRNHSAAARCWIWRGILIALLALFVFDFGPFALWAYRAKVSVAVKAEDRVAYNREAEYLEIIHSWEGMEAIKEQKREQSYLSNNPLPPWDWSSLIITLKDIQRSPWKEINATLPWIIWSVSTLLILLWITRLFIGARLLARSGSFANQDWQLLAAHVAEELKIHKIPLVRIIESVSSPLLSGFRIPVICLSPYALLWSREKLRVVFLHELAHWKRWDYGWQQIGKLVVALFWWNPLARMAAVRMSAEAEQAADDVVVLHETPAKVYAETLIEIASGISFANNPSAGISMIGYRSVEKRIRALLANNPWRGRIGRLAGFAILVAVLLTLGVSSVYVGFAAPVAAPAAKGQTVTKLTPEQRKLLERIFKNITERLTAMRFLHFKIDTLVKQENKADQLTKVDVWVDEWSGIHRSEIQRSPFNAVNNIDLNNGRHSYFFTPGANPEFLQGGKPEGVAYYLRIDETIDLAHLISVILQSSVLSRGEGEGVEISEVKWNGKKTVQLREKIPVNFTKEGKGIQQRTWRVDPASDDMLCFYERAFPTWNTYKPSQWTLQESGIADGNLYPKRYQYTQDQSQNWETSTEDNTVTFLEVLKKLPEGITALPKSEILMPGLKNEKRVDAEEASASATDLSSPEALALYDQVKAKYSSCSSFYCDGENKTTSTTLRGILPFKSETKFSIRFQRPALLRVDWVQPFPWPASLIAPANCSLYTEGGKYFTVTSFQRNPREMKSLNDAMGTAAGISAGASYMIPSLLLGAPGYFKDAACKILPDAKVGSRECSVLKLVIAKRGEDYTIYIDKTTSGILRIEDIKILNGKEREKMLAERKVANEKRKAESKSSLPEVPPVGYTINRNIEYTAVAFDQEMKPEDFIFKDKKE